ncbi:unnamed protein product [Aphanomyces euteiches]|uniref:Choline transporter-like protein n=1 Tax=Aphanomyces euteiches TaxID=100861 RepID=A0A6G0WYB7_9STRA|nr:hypothetical protein Ae201684_010305 [Aphanomyces euteiches]KAH9090329.1 hypothetical protein Ae201684P_014135 [Aphanomyces euteiches]
MKPSKESAMAMPVMTTDLATFGSVVSMKPHLAAPTRGWNDWPFAILFFLNVAAIATLLGVYGSALFKAAGSANSLSSFITNQNLKTVLAICGVLSAIATLLAFLMLELTIRYARAMIQIGLWFAVTMCLVCAGWAGYKKQIALAVLFGVLSLISICYAFAVQTRIPFAAANLKVAASAIRTHGSMHAVAFLFLVLQLAWVFVWCVAVVGITNHLTDGTAPANSPTGTLANGVRCSKNDQCISNNCVASGGLMLTSRRVCRAQTAFTQLRGEAYVAYFFLLVSFFWGVNVCKNILHVTVAGAVGSWWHTNQTTGVVRGSLKRASSTSLGSICLGSLLVAILQALRQLAEEARRQGDCTACIAECILGCLQSIMETFNRWAFVYVGMYGYKFLDAGRAVTSLFHERGFDAIITDDMVGTSLGFAAFGVGGCCGLLGYAAYFIDHSAQFPSSIYILPIAGLVVGLGIAMVPLGVIDSAVATVYVCFAEDPAALQLTHPQEYQLLMAEWHRMYPEIMMASGYFVVI